MLTILRCDPGCVTTSFLTPVMDIVKKIAHFPIKQFGHFFYRIKLRKKRILRKIRNVICLLNIFRFVFFCEEIENSLQRDNTRINSKNNTRMLFC